MRKNSGPGGNTRPVIVLVIATLGAGGAERVLSALAGEWARRGNRVCLITLGAAGYDYYPLDKGVKRVGLDVLAPSHGRMDAIKNNFKRVAKLRSAILAENPGAILSFMDSTNVLVLLAMTRTRVPVIVSERIDPRHYPIAAGWNLLRRKLYPKATSVVVQTPSVAEWALDFLPADKVHVIPNPVQSADHQLNDAAQAVGQLPTPYIVAMGRLDRQKGFDLLLEAFAVLPPEFHDHQLVILGDGLERNSLEQLAAELKVDHRLVMRGRVKEPGPVLAKATCFVLSSRYEGFPNALLEAMAVGLPVISFNCPSGPADIITHEKNGLLVPPEDVTALAAAMAQVLGDKDARGKMGRAAQEEIKKFSIEQVTDQWEKLF